MHCQVWRWKAACPSPGMLSTEAVSVWVRLMNVSGQYYLMLDVVSKIKNSDNKFWFKTFIAETPLWKIKNDIQQVCVGSVYQESNGFYHVYTLSIIHLLWPRTQTKTCYLRIFIVLPTICFPNHTWLIFFCMEHQFPTRPAPFVSTEVPRTEICPESVPD